MCRILGEQLRLCARLVHCAGALGSRNCALSKVSAIRSGCFRVNDSSVQSQPPMANKEVYRFVSRSLTAAGSVDVDTVPARGQTCVACAVCYACGSLPQWDITWVRTGIHHPQIISCKMRCETRGRVRSRNLLKFVEVDESLVVCA